MLAAIEIEHEIIEFQSKLEGERRRLNGKTRRREKHMAKTVARKKRVVRRGWTRADVKELRQHSKSKSRVTTISRALKRTPGALRQKARALGIPLGHQRIKTK